MARKFRAHVAPGATNWVSRPALHMNLAKNGWTNLKSTLANRIASNYY